MLQASDAALIIGDPALRVSLGIEKDSWSGAPGQTVCQAATLDITSAELLYVYDVVAEWRALTGLPAVNIKQFGAGDVDRKSTRLNSSHRCISYAVFCLKK